MIRKTRDELRQLPFVNDFMLSMEIALAEQSLEGLYEKWRNMLMKGFRQKTDSNEKAKKYLDFIEGELELCSEQRMKESTLSRIWSTDLLDAFEDSLGSELESRPKRIGNIVKDVITNSFGVSNEVYTSHIKEILSYHEDLIQKVEKEGSIQA